MFDIDTAEIKIILLGESGTGKSNLVNICCNLKFNQNTTSNVSSSILEKKITIGNVQYSLKFWDTAGQEKFRSLNNIFIKDSKICIFIYDVNNYESFEALNYWVKSAKEILGNDAVYGVVANKIDLEEKVSQNIGEEFANNLGALFCQVSAKDDTGEFTEFVNKLVEEYLNKNNLKGWEIVSKEDRISITSLNNMQPSKKSFC